MKKTYGNECREYIGMLLSNGPFSITISKRLLICPVIPIWAFLLAIFLVPDSRFFAMVGIGSLIVCVIYLIILFPAWNACNISIKAYIIFHSFIVIILKTLSIPLYMLLEKLWTLCI